MTKGHYYRETRKSLEESRDRSAQIIGEVLRQEHLPGNIREGGQGLAQFGQGTEELWLQFGLINFRL